MIIVSARRGYGFYNYHIYFLQIKWRNLTDEPINNASTTKAPQASQHVANYRLARLSLSLWLSKVLL